MGVPVGLGERGMALWVALSSGDTARDSLALEVARTADRLDELDNIIQGKGVLNLMQFRVHALEDDGEDRNINVEVKFAAPLAEARQQGAALAGLLTKLGISEAPAGASNQPLPANVSPLSKLRDKMKA